VSSYWMASTSRKKRSQTEKHVRRVVRIKPVELRLGNSYEHFRESVDRVRESFQRFGEVASRRLRSGKYRK